MSKYYKAEDVINAIEDKIAEYIPTLYGRYAEIPLELRMAIEHLLTIEVSEDCIDRKALLEQIDKDSDGQPGWYGDTWQFIKTIENAPSVTTEQSSKVGEWVETPDGTMCGNCNKFPYDDGEYHIANWNSDYCPNCGAKMKV